ncbi:hypothetical protein HPP92_022784 [Vanilla planifolia]|uniref:Homogentisate phytyltransferase n=1 Tax=Vanilla planifolia TaxID=51239 RepID=A0A835UHJ8_VANPL|nr:hypothetical protein HPP92_022784 [Vanilla planifolia]
MMAMSMDYLLPRSFSSPPRVFSSRSSSKGCCSQGHNPIQQCCLWSSECWKKRGLECHSNSLIRLKLSRSVPSDRWKHVKASSGQSLEPEPEACTMMKEWEPLRSALNAFYRFSRPHTVIGTALSIISVSLLAVENLADISLPFFTGMFQALISALFMNIYIVGLNQLSDIEIDKVNKPTLPLASGEYSFRTASVIVSVFAVLSFSIGWMVGSWPLFCALFISFCLEQHIPSMGIYVHGVRPI